MLLLGAWQVGVSTDEPVHVDRFANLLDHGWYLLDDDLVGDDPGPWVTDQYVYGPVFTEVLHGVNRVIGLDPPGALGTSVDAYVARHVVIALFGLIATLGVAAIGRRLLGSWRWGVVAAGMLMAIPMWPGLSMFDFKDVPTATGYTLVTLGLVELLHDQRPRRQWAATAVLTSGLVLAVGTRPGLWPGVAASVGLAFLLGLRRQTRWHLLGRLAVAGVAAYAVLVVAYPAYFTSPGWVLGSVLDSADYTADQRSGIGSWAYLPTHVVVLMPPLLLFIGVVGCLITVGRVRLTPQTAGWLLVLSQAMLLPTLAVVRQSLLYDGLRQVLFACPAVALLLTAGWKRITDDSRAGSHRVGRVVAVTWAVALLAPLLVQVQLFPYAYTYAAPYADALGAGRDNDYWRVSYRELLDQVPRDEFLICYPQLSAAGDTVRYMPPAGRPTAESSADCRTDPASTLTPFDLAHGDPEPYVVRDTFLAIFSRNQIHGRNCEDLGSVERRRYLTSAVMSTVARCDLVLDNYPDAGLALTSDGTGAQYLLGGWTAKRTDPGVVLRERAGSLGFRMPDEWVTHPLTVRLMGTAAAIPEVSVNNRPIEVSAGDGGWVVEVPAAVAASMGEQRLVVTIRQPVGDPLRLTGVSASPS
jgi:hypothetical protein